MPPKHLPSPSTSRLRSVTGSAIAVLLSLACLGGPSSEAQSLIGSRAALVKAGGEARQHGYTYLRTGSQVREFVNRGLLVRLSGNSSYRVNSVSYPYARPEVKLFVERLSRQYRSACGEKLVVTSLTRPLSRQPANASHLSVHPTGMAMDLRRSSRASCRRWLESTLLKLEDRGVLEATKENHPPHYHVSLFPQRYTTYLASRGDLPRGSSSGTKMAVASDTTKYRVRGGDSLWEIARRHGTSVSQIKRANGISSSRLKPGQMLQIPAR
ncbi:MAG TPA: DUF5715 family protein [Thermoanaerobaculia bacterium]|nr:DUF5715 family protein [Thermoanaerobaculia bacterium]